MGGRSLWLSNWRGPWPVLERESNGVVYRVQDPRTDTVHRVHVQRMRPANLKRLPSENVFWANVKPGTDLVERIVAHRVVNGELQFYVKWAGGDDDFNTWEPVARTRAGLGVGHTSPAKYYLASHPALAPFAARGS